MQAHAPDQSEPTDPTRRYRCRHVFTDGHRCGSPALRTQDLCFYHHASRREPRLAPGNGLFFMPRIDDRAALQIAIYDILARVTLRDIDLKSAGLVLRGLQIASSNLTQQEKSARTAAPNPEPLVEDVVENLFLGALAPIAEYAPEPAQPPAPPPTPQPAPSPTLSQQHPDPEARQHPQQERTPRSHPSRPASSPLPTPPIPPPTTRWPAITIIPTMNASTASPNPSQPKSKSLSLTCRRNPPQKDCHPERRRSRSRRNPPQNCHPERRRSRSRRTCGCSFCTHSI